MQHTNTIPPTHEDFHWITGPGQEQQFADFIELARDVSTGIHSCLQIIYASDLAREANLDADPGQETPPAIGTSDAAHLFRLSMAAVRLLGHAAEERIEMLNKFWDE